MLDKRLMKNQMNGIPLVALLDPSSMGLWYYDQYLCIAGPQETDR